MNILRKAVISKELPVKPFYGHITIATYLPDDEEFVQGCSEIFRETPSFRIRYAKLEVLSETSIVVAVPSKPDALLALHNKIAEKYSHFMVLPGGGYVTIEIRLPENWDALIAPMGYEPLSHFVLDEDK